MRVFGRLIRFGVAIALVVPVVVWAPSAAMAEHQGHGRIVPSTPTAGLTGGELLGQRWAYSLTQEPDAPASCVLLAGGKVVQPNGSVGCRVRAGTPVFIDFSVEISNLESPFSSDEATQRREARTESKALVVSLDTSVDGGPVTDIHARRFVVTSRQMEVQLPANNLFGVPAQTINFTAWGWAATIKGLTPGHHVIHVDAVVDPDDPLTFPFDLVVDVLPRHCGR